MHVLKYGRDLMAILILLLLLAPIFVSSSRAESSANNESPALALVFQDDFAKLEKETGAWLKSYSEGAITGDAFFKLFHSILPTHTGLEYESHFRKWIEKYPQSYAANLLTGMYYLNLAWTRRGSSFANQTTQKQFDDFAKYLLRAEHYLLKSTGQYAKPYPSYCYLIATAKGLSNGKGAEYYSNAVGIDPAAYEARSRILEQFSPKWGGSFALLDEFNAIAKQSLMSDSDKKRIEARVYLLKGERMQSEENYVAAIEFYRKAYYASPGEEFLWTLNRAGTIAQDADLDEQAIALFSEAISAEKNPNTYALTHRGAMYEAKKKNLEKAFSDFKVAAEAGDSWAQNRIGWWYLTGIYVAKDYAAAEQYFLRAAAQGNDTAKENLKMLARLRVQ